MSLNRQGHDPPDNNFGKFFLTLLAEADSPISRNALASDSGSKIGRSRVPADSPAMVVGFSEQCRIRCV